MTYRRIEEASQLPPPGPPNPRAREKGDLDFKVFADRRVPWEHAKDIAAFANSLGGALLVGADDQSGSLIYPGLHGQTVADVKEIYENAAKMCSPTPVVDVVPFEVMPGGPVVVAVNVDAYQDQAVASPAATYDRAGGTRKHDHAWVFPIRRASQTEFIDPESLPMYMNREIRRAVLMLSKLPRDGSEITVHFHLRTATPTYEWIRLLSRPLRLGDVSVEKNRVRLLAPMAHNPQCSVPLLDVIDVWESAEGKWDVMVAGQISEAAAPSQLGPRLVYQPLPRT